MLGNFAQVVTDLQLEIIKAKSRLDHSLKLTGPITWPGQYRSHWRGGCHVTLVTCAGNCSAWYLCVQVLSLYNLYPLCHYKLGGSDVPILSIITY